VSVGCNPDEALATIDTPTYIRARSREKLIAKAQRRWGPQPPEWEEIVLEESA
jgi:hypothetical protein